MEKIYTFLLINFIVSFIADIVLNDLSKIEKYHYFTSLAPYFKDKYITVAGIYAGITIVVALIFQIVISKTLLGYYIPITNNELLHYCILAYILGYIIDKAIEKLSIFGKSLDKFYEIVGSGHSGAVAFIVSIIMSYFLQNNLLPLLK